MRLTGRAAGWQASSLPRHRRRAGQRQAVDRVREVAQVGTRQGLVAEVVGLIRSSADKRSAAVLTRHAVRGLPLQIQSRARAKLQMVDAAVRFDDLRPPPGSRLEALRGD